MTQPIDVAYVVLEGITKPFEKDIKSVIDGELKNLEREVDKTTKKIEKDFDDAGKNIEGVFDRIVRTVKKVAHDVGETFQATFNTVDLGIRRTTRRIGNNFDAVFTRIKRNSSDLLDKLVPIRAGLALFGESVQKGFTAVGGALSNVVSNLNVMTILIGTLIVLIPGLTGMLIGLGAVLQSAAGILLALPAGLSVLAATISTVTVAFNGFGEAISAIISKDPEKIKEALAALSPNAASVAREIQAFMPKFEAIRRRIQNILFEPLLGDFTRLMNAIIIPLETGMARVAKVIGGIISDFAELASSPLGVDTLNAVFTTTATVLQRIRDSLRETLGPTLMKLIQATLPLIEKLNDKFFSFLELLANQLSASIEDGSFQKFLDEAVESLDKLLGLIGALLNMFGALFGPETLNAGQEMLTMITDLINEFTTWLGTTEGKQFLEDLANNIKFVTMVIGGWIIILGELFYWLTTIISIILDFFGVVDRTIVKTKEFGQTLDDGLAKVVTTVEGIPNKLKQLGGKFADAGLSLITSFINGFKTAGSFIGDVASGILNGIKGGLNKMISSINRGIAALDLVLPGNLARIPSLAEGGISPATPGGRLVHVSEAGEAEAIIPLSKLESMLSSETTGTGTMVFEPGSIVINFHGVVPTAEEARQVGESVAQGIHAASTRQTIRAQVRAM